MPHTPTRSRTPRSPRLPDPVCPECGRPITRGTPRILATKPAITSRPGEKRLWHLTCFGFTTYR